MGLLDKLRTIRDEPADRDLAEFFGLKSGEGFAWDTDTLTVGGETVSMKDVRAAMGPPPAKRSVIVADLPAAG